MKHYRKINGANYLKIAKTGEIDFYKFFNKKNLIIMRIVLKNPYLINFDNFNRYYDISKINYIIFNDETLTLKLFSVHHIHPLLVFIFEKKKIILNELESIVCNILTEFRIK